MAPAKGKIRAGREGAPLLPGFAPPAAPAPAEPVSCSCGGTFLPVLYGRQNASMTKKASRGEAILGGCVITNESPLRACSKCRKGDGSTMGQILAKDLLLPPWFLSCPAIDSAGPERPIRWRRL